MARHPLNTFHYKERGQLKVYQRTLNSAFSLGNDERLVLLFILERTVRWRTEWAYISESEFSNGVFRRREGIRGIVVRGAALPPEKFERAITSLCEMGAIETHSTGLKTSYRINENWRHHELLEMGRLNLWDLNETDYEYAQECDEGL